MTSTACECVGDYYNPKCPHGFMHEGRYYHETPGLRRPIHHDRGPELARPSTPESWELNDDTGHNTEHQEDDIKPPAQMSQRRQSAGPEGIVLPLNLQQNRGYPRSVTNAAAGVGQERQFIVPENVRDSQETSLKRFTPLIVGGKRFTGLAIGGYNLDVEAASKKAHAALRRQPVVLPKIFSDDDLTVYHHFGRGLEAVLGPDVIREIASTSIVHSDPKGELIAMLTEMVTEDIEAGELEHVKFARQAMQSMFDTTTGPASRGSPPALLVVMNLYGFPYIEPGMILDDANARHFIQAVYASYRLLWFGLMKDTGLPHFALEGVQDRYIGKARAEPKLPKHKLVLESPDRDEAPHAEAKKSHRSAHRIDHKQKERHQSRRDGPTFRDFIRL